MIAKRAKLAAGLLFVALAAGLLPLGTHYLPLQAQAQNLGQRSVSGNVVNSESAPVTGAIVFLKNQKTKAIRSYTSAKNGSFHFAQVSMTENFDLWAEKDGQKSATKTVSSWDARKNFVVELKIK